MSMDDTALATEIKDALGFSAETTSTENEGLATAIVNHISTGVVSFLPGTINGTCSDGSPISGATAVGGVILLAPTLAAFIAELVGVFGFSTTEIIGMATAISTHVSTGLVGFASGDVTGPCAAGAFAGGGSAGTISGLDGSTLATLMAASIGKPGTTPELIAMCTAITDHISSNAESTFLIGTMTGTYPTPSGGPLAAGAGIGGSIS